ncbi:thioredoxin family protein [Aquincola sp. S2]|uniref:Thioredoxin family protein n=1 Tax=Pseudaquabacterium terrae TaxID=2732868 RepID=A0ABX2EAT8_9BURK|nr:thioredoxin family protein [Aquabacterium terrae]NRF65621.1 thioredoxin family protein [Aquabacterium terrae]
MQKISWWRWAAALGGACGIAAACAPAWAADSAVVRTDQVRAELLAHAPEGVAPGKPLMLGLLIEHQPHWHTYWRNPGDSGLPTTLTWQLPAGLAAGEIQWPRPHRLPVGPLVNYGYEGRLLLPVPVQVTQPPAGANLTIGLRADWLVCKEVCIPESGEFRLQLPAQAATAAHGALFEAARAAQPRPLANARATARVDGAALALQVDGLPAGWRGQAVEYFAADAGLIEHAGRIEARWQGERLLLRVPLSAQRSASPALLDAVLARPGAADAVQVGFRVEGAWPAPGAAPQGAAAPAVAAPGTAASEQPVPADEGMSLALAWVLAFAGGLLLNLMPCVFPVLSLKVLGFTHDVGQRRALLAGGLAYSAGVITSFVGLAALLLMLRAAGAGLGWGFQLQSPAFVAGLALLFTMLGLNLAGVFEFGKFAPDSVCTKRARRPLVDHALTGVLAVLIASPCTAPFMGAALGAALTQPAGIALGLFAMLGAGMAAPYLLIAAWPRLTDWLPRPGPWMAHFKAAMAFPMFATVVWLLWVIGQQVGVDGAAALLGLLVLVAFVAWIFSISRGGARRWAWRGGALALLVVAAGWTAPWLLRDEAQLQAAGAKLPAALSAAAWQPWSAQRVREAQATGRPVFVDFTAAWCVTCQFNKRVVLAQREVMADFERKRVLLLRADWTRKDARITAALNELGRSGVPVYALYGPGEAAPRLLSEMLSVAEVREAIAAWPSAPDSKPAGTPVATAADAGTSSRSEQ